MKLATITRGLLYQSSLQMGKNRGCTNLLRLPEAEAPSQTQHLMALAAPFQGSKKYKKIPRQRIRICVSMGGNFKGQPIKPAVGSSTISHIRITFLLGICFHPTWGSD